MTPMTRIYSPLQPPGKTAPRIALTVDLGTVGSAGDNVTAIRQFVQLVGEHHLDTTWAVSHPCQLSWVATLQNSSTSHDLAINITWATPDLSQTKFQQRFCNQWQACERVGIVPTTVYSPSPNFLWQQLSHMSQYGLTACIIGQPMETKQGRWQRGSSECIPRPLPLGLWQLPTTERIPNQRSWLRSTPAHRLPGTKRSRTVMPDMHVLIGAEQVLAHRSSGMKQLDHFLRKASWASSAEQLDVITVTEWATAMAHHTISKPQRSILRIAA
jgi:hypothetical protein